MIKNHLWKNIVDTFVVREYNDYKQNGQNKSTLLREGEYLCCMIILENTIKKQNLFSFLIWKEET